MQCNATLIIRVLTPVIHHSIPCVRFVSWNQNKRGRFSRSKPVWPREQVSRIRHSCIRRAVCNLYYCVKAALRTCDNAPHGQPSQIDFCCYKNINQSQFILCTIYALICLWNTPWPHPIYQPDTWKRRFEWLMQKYRSKLTSNLCYK